MPPEFLERYQGPQFGVPGTRRLSGVDGRPLIGTIIKPSVGLSPKATAELVDKLVEGGVDFIKDDELQADGPHCPFDERLAAVMPCSTAPRRKHREEGDVRVATSPARSTKCCGGTTRWKRPAARA